MRERIEALERHSRTPPVDQRLLNRINELEERLKDFLRQVLDLVLNLWETVVCGIGCPSLPACIFE